MGRFYTPKHLVDYAHQIMNKQFGEDWKQRYTVWDNSCGEKALTRDHAFSDLYCSTIDQSELDNSKQYNSEATTFRFDFLNDSMDIIPEGLKRALELNKEIIFFINPPYGRPGRKQDDKSRAGISAGKGNTMVNQLMKEEKMGACSSNLFAQFIYRIIKIKRDYGLTNCSIAVFGMPVMLSGTTWKKIRLLLFKHFLYTHGTLFQASHFDGTSSAWGLNFTVWKPGQTTYTDNFTHDLLDSDGNIIPDTTKVIYNLDNSPRRPLMEWLKEPTRNLKTKPGPALTSAIRVATSTKKRYRGRQVDGQVGYMIPYGNYVGENESNQYILSNYKEGVRGTFITPEQVGYYCSNGNYVEKNNEHHFMLSAMQADNHGTFIHPEQIGYFYNKSNYIGQNKENSFTVPGNFLRCTSTFAARKLIESNWVIYRDEYTEPYTDKEFQNFAMDSVIYSMFNRSSNQASLRNVEYLGKIYHIPNQFFWMPKNEIMQLAKQYGNQETINDIQLDNDTHGDNSQRYATWFIFSNWNNFSQEAKEVIKQADELVRQTFPHRQEFNGLHPEYQANNWDIGYYQLKAIAKQYCPKTLEQLNDAYVTLSNKLRPMVYQLGFLRKEDEKFLYMDIK